MGSLRIWWKAPPPRPAATGCMPPSRRRFVWRAAASEADLAAALAAFCAGRRRVLTGPLRLHAFSRYLALVPASDRADLEWLASECVTHLDGFRAPLTEADRERRPGAMSPLQRQQMEEFGYPYIFSSFFFHITLAGPLDPEALGRVEAALSPALAPFMQDPFVVDELCLFGDPGGGGAFRIIGRFPLRT